jgi:hypothetical protein
VELLDILEDNDILTENRMPTHSTSGSYLLDYFFKMGASRNLSNIELCKLFIGAINEDKDLALKALFYNRDCRGGQGERKSFRVIFRLLSILYPDYAKKLIPLIPFYGRWDDLLTTIDTPVESTAFDLILHALKNGDKLCAKWMPRDNKSLKDIAIRLRNYLGLSPKQYRSLLSGNTEVVETLMCNNKWDEINYNHIPSVAMKKYKKAFFRHDKERFSFWIDSLSKPDSKNKVHSEVLFPHDVVREIFKGVNFFSKINISSSNAKLLDAQWKGLKDYDLSLNMMLPVVDVSGSMLSENCLPISSAIGLGIYLSERNKGPFKDAFITFSNAPTLVRIKSSTIVEKVIEVSTANWAMNTNLEAVFMLVLNQAVKFSLAKESMPKYIIILSDMQFDQCITNPNDNAYQMLSRMYNDAGYTLPNIIFWNLRTSFGVPVKFDQRGTALISGYSPSIVTSLLNGELNPEIIMKNALLSERYEQIKV